MGNYRGLIRWKGENVIPMHGQRGLGKCRVGG